MVRVIKYIIPQIKRRTYESHADYSRGAGTGGA